MHMYIISHVIIIIIILIIQYNKNITKVGKVKVSVRKQWITWDLSFRTFMLGEVVPHC